MTTTGGEIPSGERPHDMTERQEIRIKNAYAAFIRRNCILDGEPVLVEMLVKDLANELFDMFVVLTKK